MKMKSRRKRIGLGIGVCAIASLLGSNAIAAEDVVKDAESLWKAAGFQISGTVLASYTQNFNNPYNNINQLRIFDTAANSFMANLTQVVFERPANASGSGMDRVGFRARLNFGLDARFSRARTNFQPGNDNTELDMQEMYAEYIAPIGNGLKIQAGKINTLIGYEVINAWENPNFSRTMMFGLSQAFTTTGIRFTYPFAKWATASIGLINGWDNVEDNNRGKSFEYLVALTPHDKFGISFFGSYGPEQSNGNAFAGTVATVGGCTNGATGCDPTAKRVVTGAIITIKPVDTTTLIIEPYYGNESNASTTSGSGNSRWNGIVTYLIHDFNDQTKPNAFSFRARGEIWEDAGGSRACAGAFNTVGNTNTCAGNGAGQTAVFGGTPVSTTLPTISNNPFVAGNGLTAWETTFTLQWKPAPALQTRVEYRYDHADHNVYLKGTQAANFQNTLGFSVAYMW
jgi:putative OmpL-like beta-barrel porin-2